MKHWQQQRELLGSTQREGRDTPTTGIAGATQNLISQSGADDILNSIDRDDENDLLPEESQHFDADPAWLLSDSLYKNSFLRKGDVVELRYVKSRR